VKPTAGYITVTNPAPGGSPSSSSYDIVEVHTPTKTIVPGPPHTYLGNDPMLFLTPAPDAVRASRLIVGDKFVISLIEVIAAPIPEVSQFQTRFYRVIGYLKFPNFNF